MTKAEKARQDEARATLREFMPPGTVVYTVLRHVSRSGMYRTLDVYVMQDGQPRRITWTVANATGFRYDRKHEALGVGGCGMDAGFEVAYNLGYYLYPEGFECAGERCRSNDHSNGDRDYSPHHHQDGGYAFRH